VPGIIFNKMLRGILWLPLSIRSAVQAFQRERCSVIFEQQTIDALDSTGVVVPGAAPWIARGGNTCALGASPATK